MDFHIMALWPSANSAAGARQGVSIKKINVFAQQRCIIPRKSSFESCNAGAVKCPHDVGYFVLLHRFGLNSWTHKAYSSNLSKILAPTTLCLMLLKPRNRERQGTISVLDSRRRKLNDASAFCAWPI